MKTNGTRRSSIKVFIRCDFRIEKLRQSSPLQNSIFAPKTKTMMGVKEKKRGEKKINKKRRGKKM